MATILQHRNLANWMLTHALWFICVLGGNLKAIIAGLCYWFVYVIYIGDVKNEWRSIVMITTLGFTIDMLLSFFGLITFSSSLPIPLWMLVLWSGFATLFHHGLGWLHSKLFLGAALGAVTGPVAYFAGVSLSNSLMGVSLTVFITLYAVLWMLYIPLFLFVAKKFIAPKPNAVINS